MFPSFIGILDIQSWWEVPSIAYFCSLFRTAFNLLDFDIEELEEALLTDGTEESASSLLTELIVRLLNGCLGNNDVSAFNYQMYLRRLFRRKCQESRRYNPFDSDIDFQFLPLRTKVEILYALCDFRLDADDVFDLFKNLEAESLRVEPLGWDDNGSAYWYFYGTRLYREDIIRKSKGKNKKKKVKEGTSRKRGWFYGDDWLDDDDSDRVWQVVCFTEEDWNHLTEKFSKATSKVEKELHRSLSQNFLPEIPRLFQEKERLQRKRLLELAPRRTSSRVLQKIKQKEEETKQSHSAPSSHKSKEDSEGKADLARENRAKRRNLLRSKSVSSDTSDSSNSEKETMPQKPTKRSKSQDKRSKNSSATKKGEPPPEPLLKTGRKTNNSLACATGQIVIPDNDEPVSSTRKKLKTSQIFSQTEEDIQTDMYKVLEQLTAHEDAWPFMDPVEEEYAPNYYAVIRRPMDLRKMEERLDTGYYTDFNMLKADFKLIVNNCRLYNGQDNEYTIMVDNLQAAFDRLTEKYIHRLSSSDEEIAVEYQLPTPSRKHKLKSSESPVRHKRKKRKSHSDAEPKSTSSDHAQEEQADEEGPSKSEVKKSKESHKSKGKKKRKGHHRHGKHSKNRKKESHKSENHESKSKHGKKTKHGKNKDKDGKKSKRKKSKHQDVEEAELKRSASRDSLESSSRSRSASPLPSIHTPSPSPSPTPPSPAPRASTADAPLDPDFYKDKYDKIKERRRNAAKDAWESLFDYKQKIVDKQKQNLHLPEKDKNQKLRETIEKLRAKNEKYKDSTLFNSLFTPGQSGSEKTAETSKSRDDPDFTDEDEDTHKGKDKKGLKKNVGKNESASEALEQAVKDISKWLDEAPKGSTGSSPCDSPAQTISTEEHDNSRLDDDFAQNDKPSHSRAARKRPSSREPKLLKRREIQRTIERLQPGKSKGNLLTNLANKTSEKVEEATPQISKTREVSKTDEPSPKLSLGSVLPTVEFALGNEHNFAKATEKKKQSPKPSDEDVKTKPVEQSTEKSLEEPKASVSKKDAEVETEPAASSKPSQEKATPNLSAWFKAFGTPKNTGPATSVKKKPEDTEEDKPDATSTEKSVSPKNTAKYDSPTDPDTPNPDGGDSPLPAAAATPRQRRTSTGSSVSERSSFSQDLDSPRHQMSHNSPLLRSPASPRTDDFQKITYPIINGTVRAGFYHDTTSIKSSPEKSCSPREAPQSPYSPYSQHVYASNNAMGSSTPNYFVDHNKSPLPTYGQNAPPYYDAVKGAAQRPAAAAARPEEYPPAAGAPEPYHHQFGERFSPYPPPLSAYSQPQLSPQLLSEPAPQNTTSIHTDIRTENKNSLFPVKKRIYNEPEAIASAKKPDLKETPQMTPNKNDYHKIGHPMHAMSSMPTQSVDDIALALSEKSEMAKLNSMRDKAKEFVATETREVTSYTNPEHQAHDAKKDAASADKSIGMMKKDNVDMVNMGYMNPEIDRRTSGESHMEYVRDMHKQNAHSAHNKGYDVDTIAINLGMNSQQNMQKCMGKSMTPGCGPVPPVAHAGPPAAHAHERSHGDALGPSMAHAHQAQFDTLTSAQSLGKFSLNDIELANKKLFACNPASSTAIDYGNWKMNNPQPRKQDVLPSDYSNVYSTSTADKMKTDIATSNATAAINYNRNIQQQYSNYNIPRSTMQRPQDIPQNMPSELKIPNPRGLLKGEHMNLASSMAENDMISKNVDAHAKTQKSDKVVQNHPLVGSLPYKTAYSGHSPLPLDGLRTLPNIPQMLERYTNDERYLSSFANSSSSLYHDKSFQMAQMFSKSMASDHPASTSMSMMYSQPATITSKDNMYKATTQVSQVEAKPKTKRKRAEAKPMQPAATASSYHPPSSCGTNVLSSVKSSMMPGSAFNFGSTTNMALSSALYGDNSFSIEDFRNSNQLMAANYMAAVAHQQRTTDAAAAAADKLVKPAHQNSTHASGSFPFLGHSQVRGGYPFVSESSSPLYQQYLQRHQEELLRQRGAQIMSLYPPPYPASLGVRQPYDSINRPSWL